MSETEEKASFLSGLKSLYAALPPEAKGFLLALVLVLVCVGALWPVLKQGRCWEFRGHEGRFFKVNACNGDVVEITEQYLRPHN
jgi:hypothetical protein